MKKLLVMFSFVAFASCGGSNSSSEEVTPIDSTVVDSVVVIDTLYKDGKTEIVTPELEPVK